MLDYHRVLKNSCGFVEFATKLDKNTRLLAIKLWKNENTDVRFTEFISELDGQFITGRQGRELLERKKEIESMTFIVRCVRNFLVDLWRKLKTQKTFRINVSSGKLESPEQHWAQLNKDRQEARKMVDKIFSVVDDDEAELLLYKWGLRSRDEIKQYFGNVSDTIISRRWKKLQAKLQAIREEL
jgi:hypothetical protein